MNIHPFSIPLTSKYSLKILVYINEIDVNDYAHINHTVEDIYYFCYEVRMLESFNKHTFQTDLECFDSFPSYPILVACSLWTTVKMVRANILTTLKERL